MDICSHYTVVLKTSTFIVNCIFSVFTLGYFYILYITFAVEEVYKAKGMFNILHLAIGYFAV